MSYLLAAIWLVLFAVLRLTLLLLAGIDDVPPDLWPAIFLKGLWFDAVVLAVAMAPIALLCALFPSIEAPGRHRSRFVFLIFSVFLMLFGVAAEVVFWQEFSTRFNFIAVDYLLYTHEVIGNIVASYPVGWLVSALMLMAALLAAAIDHRLNQLRLASTPVQRVASAGLWVLLPVLLLGTSRIEQMEGSGNTFADELSGNGIFTFAAALRRNELSYDRFYPTMGEEQAASILKELNVEHATPEALDPVQDTADDTLPFLRRPLNVILVSVESLSASYVGAWGNTRQITPNLDRLAREGYQFTNFYATGTRTVRGLEALSLGTPPIPGQAIVRRPGNEHLTTLGEILGAQGFAPYFFYGGYGYFDNMNAYFAGNHYAVIDRTEIPADQIVFENIWGVADESLYHEVITTLGTGAAADEPFFAHVMTTSNHRPYTYPDGRIDIPSPGGKEGAVKYTDHAIGQFIAEARTQSWFRDTLFIFTADHCASVAGKTRLPVDRYHIPLLFYGPDLIKPGLDERRLSQIDLAPTIVELLGAHGDGQFFGRPFFEPGSRPDIAFISNYQSLGYWRDNLLTVLLQGQRTEAFSVDPTTLETTPAPVDERLRLEAIAFYQTAAHDFAAGRLRHHATVSSANHAAVSLLNHDAARRVPEAVRG